METPITVVENNDPKLLIEVLIGGSTTPFDLTGSDVEFYLKQARGVADDDATSVLYDVGNGITVTDETGGLLEVQISAAAIPAPGTYWYHLDSVVSTRRETLMYGPLFVVDA